MSKKDEVCEGYRVGYVVGRVFGGEEEIRFMSDPGVWVDFAGMARRFALRDAERELAAMDDMDGDGMVLQLLWSGERGYYADGRDRVAVEDGSVNTENSPYMKEVKKAARALREGLLTGDKVSSEDPAPYNPERHRAAGVSLKIKRVEFGLRKNGEAVGTGQTDGVGLIELLDSGVTVEGLVEWKRGES